MVVLTQLREQVSSLQKQLSLKDQQLLAKDKQIAELKAHMSSDERNAREKMQAEKKKHSEVVQDLMVGTLCWHILLFATVLLHPHDSIINKLVLRTPCSNIATRLHMREYIFHCRCL